jgi:putative transposase
MEEALPPPRRPAWPHAPQHKLSQRGAFMVTSGTYDKRHLFTDGARLRMLHDALLTVADKHRWALQAWAVFPNHYHFIGVSPEDAGTLKMMIQELHSRTARALNKYDGSPGRKVWHNFWETHLSIESSYYARLHYVHANPVKHRLVSVANLYPYGSAAWFERTASRAQVNTVYSFKTDSLNVEDDF